MWRWKKPCNIATTRKRNYRQQTRTSWNIFKRLFPNERAIVVADATTFALAGKRVLEELAAAGISTDEPFVYNEPDMHAEMRFVDVLKERLAVADAIPIAVGSGTVNDLCKYASSLVGRSYIAVGTAASMDGSLRLERRLI